MNVFQLWAVRSIQTSDDITYSSSIFSVWEYLVKKRYLTLSQKLRHVRIGHLVDSISPQLLQSY